MVLVMKALKKHVRYTLNLIGTQIDKMKVELSATHTCTASYQQLSGCRSPVVLNTQFHAGKGRSPLSEQSLGMNNSHMHSIVFVLCMTKKKRKN